MTTANSNQDEEKSAAAGKRAQARADRLKWMNNPDAIHSMADVAEDLEKIKDGSSFCLAEGENVIASKTTAKAEAEARELARDEAINSAGQIAAAALASTPTTDQLLSQWSDQKQAQKTRALGLQDEILKRIRSEIDLEVAQILDQSYSLGYSLGSTLILLARAFGKDPRQWLPAAKVSNLFIEAVLYSAGMDLPWGFDSIPDYAELKYILGEDKRFVRVYRNDKLRPKESASDFANCPIEDGDIALWVNAEIKLSGLIERGGEGHHNILSGGCIDSPTGFIYTTLEFFVQTYAAQNPTPDAIYRVVRLGSA